MFFCVLEIKFPLCMYKFTHHHLEEMLFSSYDKNNSQMQSFVIHLYTQIYEGGSYVYVPYRITKIMRKWH